MLDRLVPVLPLGGVDASGGGLLVSASRSVIYAGGEEDIRAAAAELRTAANAANPARNAS